MLKKSKYIIATAIALSAITASAAANSFYQVGKQYLFVPRLSLVEMGTVVQVTPQEVVFDNLYTVNNSTSNPSKKDSGKKHSNAIYRYLHSKDRAKLLTPSSLGEHVRVSYSRANLSGVEVTNNKNNK